jgi:hypothetical protein
VMKGNLVRALRALFSPHLAAGGGAGSLR